MGNLRTKGLALAALVVGVLPGAAQAIGCVGTYSVELRIETCTVSQTGTYRIDAIGGQGGARYVEGTTPQLVHNWTDAGGLGGQVSGVFSLTSGTTLNILVGDWGQSTSGPGGAGGGGASGVAIGDSFQSHNVLVLAAGGGGAGPGINGGQGGLLSGYDARLMGNVGGHINGGGRNLAVEGVAGGGGGAGADGHGEGSTPNTGFPYRPAQALASGAIGGLGMGYESFGAFGGGGAGSLDGGGGGGGFYGGDGGYIDALTGDDVAAFGGSSFLHDTALEGIVRPGAIFQLETPFPRSAEVGDGLFSYPRGSVQITLIAPVPLPASLALLLAALGGLAVVRRRRQTA